MKHAHTAGDPGSSVIHPTAIIHRTAQIGTRVRIGPYAVIGARSVIADDVLIGAASIIGDDAFQPSSRIDAGVVRIDDGAAVGAHCRITGGVQVGSRTEIFDGCRLRGPITVGADCEFFDGVTVGNPAQFPGRHAQTGAIVIGDEVVLREGVTVTRPVLSDLTEIGSRSYLMARTQVDHDCRIGRNVKTATGVTMGGAVEINDGAYLGMNAVIHQNVVVGCFTMIGMNAVVMRHVPPFATVVGRRFTKLNRRGLERLGWGEDSIAAVEAYYRDGANLPGDSASELWTTPIKNFLERIGDDRFEGMCRR